MLNDTSPLFAFTIRDPLGKLEKNEVQLDYYLIVAMYDSINVFTRFHIRYNMNNICDMSALKSIELKMNSVLLVLRDLFRSIIRNVETPDLYE